MAGEEENKAISAFIEVEVEVEAELGTAQPQLVLSNIEFDGVKQIPCIQKVDKQD